jgi:antitoxin component of MazEF toxin-antitoxin module
LEYVVTRKIQEQSGSYFVHLPKIWVMARGLKESDAMTVRFNGNIEIEPAKKPSEKGAGSK